ncbi:hypothetical protein CLOM_g14181 [Closterium sp. NIES-68]|nr:hypothetical protein CLOM_g14181 [Closterium sp. NIES-68]GJP60343.1 hypothetical protein CLOP_g17545 [Closterium sp. NIES-67]
MPRATPSSSRPERCAPATRRRIAPSAVWPAPLLASFNFAAAAAPRLLLLTALAALALTVAADCAFSASNRLAALSGSAGPAAAAAAAAAAPPPRQYHASLPLHGRRVPPKQRLRMAAAPLARPAAAAARARARRSLLKRVDATAKATAGAAAAGKAVLLEASQLSALVQLNKAWGAWGKNGNASTACAAWKGVTCSPKGLVVGLDSNEFPQSDSSPTGAMPAAISTLATLQHLDLTYINLVGTIPSLATLTSLTHLALGTDGNTVTGTLDGLAWLSSLSNLQTLFLGYFAEFTGDLSSLHILSHLEKLESLTVTSFTNATGEIPTQIRYMTGLTALKLSLLRAVEFPDWVTHLSNLQSLNVDSDDPRRQGLLSDDISLLTALTSLSIGGNNLEGYLPKSWSTLVSLEYLTLNNNRLQGTIPATLSALTALVDVNLSWNYLSGTIPPAFTTNIGTLSLGYNAFTGNIPPHLALPSLSSLQLSNNLFTGGIPNAFTRLTNMGSLDVGNNSLSSGLDVVAQMTWLTIIDLSTNNFSGVLPASLTAIKNLSFLLIGDNHFTGTFPLPVLQMKSLEFLDLSNNSFSGIIPDKLAAITTLQDINLDDNKFHGTIPVGVFKLPLLNSLQVANNFLSGGLPKTLRASTSLVTLSLGGNGFLGPLPDFSLWNVSIIFLALNNNNFTGSIPDSISTLTTLEALGLNNNQLTGSIPAAIFNMTTLKNLYLASNNLSGSLPSAISRLEHLEQIWLDNNGIEGPLPSAICSLPLLWRIMASNNHLYGPIPDCLFNKCINQIDVSGNSLYGRINRNFKNMAPENALINLAHNYFYGDAVLFAAGCQVCPMEITDPNSLDLGNTFDSFAGKCISSVTSSIRDYSVAGAGQGARVSLLGNCLTLSPDADCVSNATQRSAAACHAFCSITDNGPCDGHGACVPPAPASTSNFTCQCDAGYSAIDAGNGSTCAIVNSTTTTVSSLSTGAIVGIAVGCFAGFVLLAAVLAWLLWPRGQKKWEGLDVCEQFTLQQMVKATNNWSKENVLGKGGFGIVYQGVSPQGQPWAIKRSTVMTNDFETEVRAMASLHHANLVRLLGFCLDQNLETGKQEQILVYEFVGNRDLEYHIYKTKNPLTLRQRLRLAQGAAEGLAYLHGFERSIVHRDIKPANILVTSDMNAKVADFGLLKLLTHGDADATRVAGTPGYVDPDYNRTNIITAKSDVFSFGIVLLELLSGQPPQVHKKSHIREWAMKLVEAYELDELKDSKLQAGEDSIVDFADLALDCIKAPGTRRPDMKEVAYRLNALIDKHCPDKEEEWESAAKEGSSSTGTGEDDASSEMNSDVTSGMGGRESWMSRSHGGGGSFTSMGSITEGVKSWLQMKPTKGY